MSLGLKFGENLENLNAEELEAWARLEGEKDADAFEFVL